MGPCAYHRSDMTTTFDPTTRLALPTSDPVIFEPETDIDVLTNTNRGQIHVVDRLGVPGQQDDPAGVECKINVGVVAADVQRTRNGPGSNVQHHRNPGRCLNRQLFQCV